MIDRRAALSMIAAAPLAGCASFRSPTTTPPIVLIHGAWHGGWCWDRTANLLKRDGFETYAPTLPGQGDKAAEISDSINLDTHIDFVCDYINARNLSDVILVGHSYGGNVVTGAADRIKPRLQRLIYLDALVVENGNSLADNSGGSAGWERRVSEAKSKGHKGLPPFPPAAFGVLDPSDQAWLAPRLTEQPFNTFAQKLVLRHPLGNGLPKVYIDCTQPAMQSVNAFKLRIRSETGWTYERLASGHDAMITAPRELSELIKKYA